MAVPPNHPILIPLFLETPILFYKGFYASYLLQRNENGPKKPPNPSPHFVSQLTQAASSSEAPWIQTAGHEANEIIPQTSFFGFASSHELWMERVPPYKEFFWMDFVFGEKSHKNQRKSDEFGLNYLGKFSGQVSVLLGLFLLMLDQIKSNQIKRNQRQFNSNQMKSTQIIQVYNYN